MWQCPECDRRFGRKGQGHECSPGLSLEEYFESGPEFERPIFDVIHAHVRSLDPDNEIWVEPVQVGIFFKYHATFMSLRTMTRWIAVNFTLGSKLEHGRLSRKVQEQNGRYYHTVNVRDAAEIDDVLLGWITDAVHHELSR